MRELSQILYSPLKEEDRVLTGWSKSTIDYIQSHKTKICNAIRGIAKSLGKCLQKSDVDEVYQEFLIYMHKSDDYNISKACERSSSGVIVSLEGYVHSCAKYCVKRYITKEGEIDANQVPDIVKDEDGKEFSRSDSVADTKDHGFDNICYELHEVCKTFECQRYLFGPDLFQIWFVRLLTMIYKKDDKYVDILTVLGVSRADIAAVQREAHYDGAMLSIAKAISIAGIEVALEVIRDYTYSADKIQRVVELYNE